MLSRVNESVPYIYIVSSYCSFLNPRKQPIPESSALANLVKAKIRALHILAWGKVSRPEVGVTEPLLWEVHLASLVEFLSLRASCSVCIPRTQWPTGKKDQRNRDRNCERSGRQENAKEIGCCNRSKEAAQRRESQKRGRPRRWTSMGISSRPLWLVSTDPDWNSADFMARWAVSLRSSV